MMLDGPEFLRSISGQAGVDRLTQKPAVMADPDALILVTVDEQGYAMTTHPGTLQRLSKLYGAQIWSGDRTSDDSARPWM